MNDQHSTLKFISLPNGVEIIPLNAWLFAIQSSFRTFQSWHETLYKNKGKHFPIYRYQYPLPSPSQLSIPESESTWEDVYEFIRQWLLKNGAITIGDLSLIQLDDIRDNPIGDELAYLELSDILEFANASKIGQSQFDHLRKTNGEIKTIQKKQPSRRINAFTVYYMRAIGQAEFQNESCAKLKIKIVTDKLFTMAKSGEVVGLSYDEKLECIVAGGKPQNRTNARSAIKLEMERSGKI